MIEPALSELPELTAADLSEERWADWFLTRLGSSLDDAMLQAMRFVIDAVVMPRPQDLPELRRSAQPFRSGELWSEPRRFFSFMDEPVMPHTITARHRRPIDGGTIVARELTTAYRPYAGMENVAGVDAPHDDRVLIEHWMHEPGRPLATVVALGRGDRIVPPDHPHALWHHWDEPDIYWFSGSHVAPFRRGLLLAAILEHVGRCVGTAAQRRASARRTDAGWRAGEDHVAG